MRSLTRRSLFSTSMSTVSFNPDDCAPSVSTTLGYKPLASEGSICSSPAARQPGAVANEADCSRPSVHLNGPACDSFRPVSCSSLPVLRVKSSSPSDCCCGAEPPAVIRPEGQPAKKKEWRKRKSENQFLIKQICKGCIKRCSTFALARLSVWRDLENPMLRLTNSMHVCWGRRCCFCLPLDW